MASPQVSATEEKDGTFQISIDGEQTHVLQQYDDFYGLYWETNLDVERFFESIWELTERYESNGAAASTEEQLKDSLISGILTQDYNKDTDLSSDELRELFSDEDWPDTDYEHLSEYISEHVSTVNPARRATFFRVNTQFFNSSWECTDSTARYGLLSHKQPTEAVAAFCVTATESIDLENSNYEAVVGQLTEILEGHTKAYAENEP